MSDIMIVDDEFIIIAQLEERLISMGYTVVGQAFSGEEALELAEQLNPDLILMDIHLAGEMDGVAAARKIRARIDLPVIYLTAYAEDDLLQRAKVTEPYSYLIKPVQTKELLATIEMALYKHETEKKLKDHERWLAATLKSIGDAVITTDAVGRVTFMNPVAEALTGWSQAEAMGHNLSAVFHIVNEVTGLPVENPVMLVLSKAQGDSLPGEFVVSLTDQTLLIAREGPKIPIDDSAAPIKDDKGKLTGVVLVFRDITERKRAEAEREKLIADLQKTLAQVRQLSGLLPICTNCKKIRNDEGYWQDVAVYIRDHSEAEFSHGICPECVQILYPDLYKRPDKADQEILAALQKLDWANLEDILAEVDLDKDAILRCLQNTVVSGQVRRMDVDGETFYRLS